MVKEELPEKKKTKQKNSIHSFTYVVYLFITIWDYAGPVLVLPAKIRR